MQTCARSDAHVTGVVDILAVPAVAADAVAADVAASDRVAAAA
jgi:hypothetical protein